MVEYMIWLLRDRHYENNLATVRTVVKEKRLGDLSRFFIPPPPAPEWRDSLRILRRGQGYLEASFVVPSPVTSPHPENNVVTGRLWRPAKGHPLASVLLLHGAMVGHYLWYNRLARRLARQGFQVVFPHLPYHFDRTPPGQIPGEFIVGGDFLQALDLVQQGVADLRSLLGRLRAESDRPLGVIGTSLGGYFAGWLAVLESSLDFAVLIEPAVDLAAILYETPLGRLARRSLQGLSEVDQNWLRQGVSSLSPGTYPLAVPLERVLIQLPLFDKIVPPQGTLTAWERWGRPPLLRYPAGHLTLFFQSRLVPDVEAFVTRYSLLVVRRSLATAP